VKGKIKEDRVGNSIPGRVDSSGKLQKLLDLGDMKHLPIQW